MILFKKGIGVLLLALMAGCATPVKPGLTSATDKLDLGEDGLVLLTTELSNDFRPSYQPEAMMLNVETPNAKESADRLNFVSDKDGTAESPTGNKYIFRARLKAGKYVIRGITGKSGIFPVMGSFFVPLHCDIEAKKGKVLNLGKVVAHTRERQGNEFRAGPVIPLLDQAVTGFAGSTFDVQITPSQQADLVYLKVVFPVLQTVEVIEEPLPPFNRDAAQKWWEAH